MSRVDEITLYGNRFIALNNNIMTTSRRYLRAICRCIHSILAIIMGTFFIVILLHLLVLISRTPCRTTHCFFGSVSLGNNQSTCIAHPIVTNGPIVCRIVRWTECLSNDTECAVSPENCFLHVGSCSPDDAPSMTNMALAMMDLAAVFFVAWICTMVVAYEMVNDVQDFSPPPLLRIELDEKGKGPMYESQNNDDE